MTKTWGQRKEQKSTNVNNFTCVPHMNTFVCKGYFVLQQSSVFNGNKMHLTFLDHKSYNNPDVQKQNDFQYDAMLMAKYPKHIVLGKKKKAVDITHVIKFRKFHITCEQ